MSSLQALLELVQNATNATRERIVDGVMEEGYMKKLFRIFQVPHNPAAWYCRILLQSLSAALQNLAVRYSSVFPYSSILRCGTATSRCRILPCSTAESCRAVLQNLGAVLTWRGAGQDCEDLEMTNSLHTLFRIFKGLIMLNDPSLIEKWCRPYATVLRACYAVSGTGVKPYTTVLRACALPCAVLSVRSASCRRRVKF
eukprot:2567868-Rhodomonas_salina.1